MNYKSINRFKGILVVLFLSVVSGILAGAGEGGFRFPLKQGTIALSGTFGELRTNHFHSGIDVKTGGEIGKPIYAIEDGWVYRLKVSPYGFGKAVYLKHPDGKFSVYAHLSRFNEEMAEFIYQKQYASKSFEQEIYLSQNRINVKKGDHVFLRF